VTQVNDQVLTQIGFSLGQTEQIPPADLPPVIQPVVQADDYRQKVEVLNLSGSTSVAAGGILGLFEPGDLFSWLIFSGSIIWGGGDLIETELTVIDRTGAFNRVAALESEPASTRVVVGAGAVRAGAAPSLTMVENAPESIFVPSGGKLRIDAQRKVDEVASYTARFMAFRRPPVRLFDRRNPDTATFP